MLSLYSQNLFSSFTITALQEMNLAANQRREDVTRLTWWLEPGERVWRGIGLQVPHHKARIDLGLSPRGA